MKDDRPLVTTPCTTTDTSTTAGPRQGWGLGLGAQEQPRTPGDNGQKRRTASTQQASFQGYRDYTEQQTAHGYSFLLKKGPFRTQPTTWLPVL